MKLSWMRQLCTLALLALMALTPGYVRGQGLILPPDGVRTQPFYVKDLKVNAVINAAVAETTVSQTVVNTTSAQLEATYLYPLPEGATPTSFTMQIGDRVLEPKILTKDEARTYYESIVRRRQDPALLEYVGRNLVRVSVFPIPPQGERVLKLRYTEVLKPENGLRRYGYTLSTSRFGSRPVGSASVNVTIKTVSPLRNVYSPSHDVAVRKRDEHNATASWEGVNEASDRDLTLYYSTSADDVGLSLLTYKSGERDGYFMLLAAPRVTVPKDRVLPKSVVFVFDKTGSMAGEKIKQARKALAFCLDRLNPQDRFNVVAFSDAPDVLFKELVPASEANVAKAKTMAAELEASGGTNIEEGLRSGLSLLKGEAEGGKMLVFMTDGLPTLGEVNVETILKNVRSLNGTGEDIEIHKEVPGGGERVTRVQRGINARIFSFGVGYDVNVPFLDRLGELGRGDSDYVKPEEDIEAKVSAFYAKVASPVLSDVRLAFDGANVYDIYPKALPDLFKGSQLVVTGRFRGNGAGTVKLTGRASGGTKEAFAQSVPFGDTDGRNAYLPRIWAARRIGYLADQLRLSANPEGRKEVVDEIVRLSREYGIITEYTSFLVDENEQRRLGVNVLPNGISASDIIASDANGQIVLREEVAKRARAYGEKGEGATNQSLRGKELKNSDKTASRYQTSAGGVVAQNAPSGPGGFSGPVAGKPSSNYFGGRGGAFGGSAGRLKGGQRPGENVADTPNLEVTVQAMNGRAFYRQKNNLWLDQSYDTRKNKLTQVRAYSDAHFALLKAVPELASWSSAGDEVIVRLGRNAVQIGKAGKEKLTAAELKELTAR